MEKKRHIQPLFVLAVGLTACVALGVWVQRSTPGLFAMADKTATEQAAVAASEPAKNLIVSGAPPKIDWIKQPFGVEQGRVGMAFTIMASAPIRSLELRIIPTEKLHGLGMQAEDIPLQSFMLNRKAISWDGQIDLTGSLLAGTQVRLQLVTEDQDSRKSESLPYSIALPERAFSNQAAREIYTLRKMLQQDPDTKRMESLRALAGLLQKRETFNGQDLALLTLRSAAVRIALDKSDDGLRSALDLLWHAAVLFEENQLQVAVKS